MNPRIWRRLVLSVLAVVALAFLALRTRDTADDVVERRFLAMGTEIRIVLPLHKAARAPQAEAAIDALQARFIAFGRDWAPWGDGVLAALNAQLLAGQRIEIPETMRPLWSRTSELQARIGGGFEPRIGALVRLWGFDEAARLHSAPPPQAEIDVALAALQAAPMTPQACAQALCYGPAPGVQWDFGAIAKGWIVDQALAELRSAGFSDALVDAGGNLAVRGAHGKRPWRVAIRNPRGDGTASPRFLATVEAHDEAVNTHGDYERYFEWQGQRYCHLLDPSTGSPAQGLESVTVLDADASWADAAGAALFVAGPQTWRERARQLGLEQVLVVDAQQRVYATPALAPRLRAEPGIDIQVLP